jgi:hypothetical protein
LKDEENRFINSSWEYDKAYGTPFLVDFFNPQWTGATHFKLEKRFFFS